MFNNEILEVVIGLIFIYLLYSLLATTIQETISTVLHRRANTLCDGIRSMLSNTKKDKGFFINFIEYVFIGLSIDFWKFLNKLFGGKKEANFYRKFYDHPIIKNYGQNLFFKKPSYLTPENFSSILIETLKNLDPANVNTTATFALIKSAFEAHKSQIDNETSHIITYHLNEAGGDLNVFKFRIEKWYNDTMDRVSGWYKRNTQFYLLFVGMFLAVSLNVDTIEITNYLSDNKPAREQLAKMGEAAANNPHFSVGDSAIAKEAMDSIRANINRVDTLVGLGWGDYGSSDTAFKNYCLSDSIDQVLWFDPDTTELYKAFKINLSRADSTFKADSAQLCARMLKDSSLQNEYIDSTMSKLTEDRNDIISQIQFALLYKNGDFDNYLRTKYVWNRVWHWKKLFGFLITALAISLGATFWFDLLNKFVSLRTAVKTVNSSGSTTRNNASDNNEIDG